MTSWQRDRLGYFSPYDTGAWSYSKDNAHFVSAPIDLEGGAARLTVNVDGITEYSSISVEIQDQMFQAISGYESDVSKAPGEGGLARSIIWQSHDLIENVAGPIRVRVNFEGLRSEDVRLYAVYLDRA